MLLLAACGGGGGGGGPQTGDPYAMLARVSRSTKTEQELTLSTPNANNNTVQTVPNYHPETDFLDVPNGTELTIVDDGTNIIIQNKGGNTLVSLPGASFGDAGTYDIHFLSGDSGDNTLSATNIAQSGGSSLVCSNDYFEDWYIRGKGGDDTLNGSDGDDILYGEAGVDRLKGDVGDDQPYGGARNDTLDGGAGEDLLNGGGAPINLLYVQMMMMM